MVGEADGGTAEFADGTVTSFEVVGRDPLSALAVVRTDRGGAESTPMPARSRAAARLVDAVVLPTELAD